MLLLSLTVHFFIHIDYNSLFLFLLNTFSFMRLDKVDSVSVFYTARFASLHLCEYIFIHCMKTQTTISSRPSFLTIWYNHFDTWIDQNEGQVLHILCWLLHYLQTVSYCCVECAFRLVMALLSVNFIMYNAFLTKIIECLHQVQALY